MRLIGKIVGWMCAVVSVLSLVISSSASNPAEAHVEYWTAAGAGVIALIALLFANRANHQDQ